MAHKKLSHVQNVNALFEKIREVASENMPETEWLATAKKAALNKHLGWISGLEGFINGLNSAKQISPEAFRDLNEKLTACIENGLGISEIYLPAAGVVCIAALTAASITLYANWMAVLFVLGLSSIVIAWWASQWVRLQSRHFKKQNSWARAAVILLVAIALPVVFGGIASVSGLLTSIYSIHRFNSDREVFLIEPQGFPMLREFAHKNFNVDVILGKAEDSWAPTTLMLVNPSPASISLGPGYCMMNMNRDTLALLMGTPSKEDTASWTQGVMMHELGHCLDIRRDLYSGDGLTVKVHAIAPIDVLNVKDIPSYLAMSDEESTTLWREAFADIFAVGYWRIAVPMEADRLVTNLRNYRIQGIKSDKTHATACWIDQVKQAPLPASVKELVNWADQQRIASECVISKPAKPNNLDATRFQVLLRKVRNIGN